MAKLTSASFSILVDVETRQRYVSVKLMPPKVIADNIALLLAYMSTRHYPGAGNSDTLLDIYNAWTDEQHRRQAMALVQSLK